MINKLKKINEELIESITDQKEREKQLIIKKILKEKNCFFKMDIYAAFLILSDLKIKEEEIKRIYEELIDSKNFIN